MSPTRVALILLLPFLTLGMTCHRTSSLSNLPQIFFSTMTRMVIQVAYEPGAEPYDGSLSGLSGVVPWRITRNNVAALFEGRAVEPEIDSPLLRSEMTLLPEQNKTTWTLDEIFALSEQYRNGTTTAETGHFFVAFLNGHLVDETGSPNPGIIGVQISGTSVVAIFKDVIKAMTGTNVVRVFVEQSTVIHEIGHALGLVNIGVPPTSDHHDEAHGAHCDNPDCVMYWQNEGLNDLISFVNRRKDDPYLFADECLQDTRSFEP